MSDKLQSKDLDVVTGCERVADLLEAIKELRSEEKFESFGEATIARCDHLGIEEPKEERVRKLPKRLDQNQDTAVHLDAKDKLRINFFYNVSLYFNAFPSLIFFVGLMGLLLTLQCFVKKCMVFQVRRKNES